MNNDVTLRNKNKYEKDIKRFVDNGYVEILFENDEFALCNFANHCYLFFPHAICDYAILINSKQVMTCLNDHLTYFSTFGSLSDEDFRKITCIIDDNLFNIAKETKAKTDKNGPSKFIDLELDKYVLENFSNKKSGMRK